MRGVRQVTWAGAATPDGTPPQQAAARHQGIRLAEVLAARLCHEFGGPLGTVAAAVDLARGDDDTAAEALALAGEAAGAMTTRLRLVRAAWAGGIDATDSAGLCEICRGLPPQVALRADLEGARFPAPVARLLVNVALLAADSMPRGGQLTLASAGPGATLAVLHGRDAAWPAGFASWIADPSSAWRAAATAGPRTLQGPLTALLADAAGVRLSFSFRRAPEGAPPLLMQVG